MEDPKLPNECESVIFTVKGSLEVYTGHYANEHFISIHPDHFIDAHKSKVDQWVGAKAALRATIEPDAKLVDAMERVQFSSDGKIVWTKQSEKGLKENLQFRTKK